MGHGRLDIPGNAKPTPDSPQPSQGRSARTELRAIARTRQMIARMPGSGPGSSSALPQSAATAVARIRAMRAARRRRHSAGFGSGLGIRARPANDTAVQRRTGEGAKRPTRPSDCNGGLGSSNATSVLAIWRGERGVGYNKKFPSDRSCNVQVVSNRSSGRPLSPELCNLPLPGNDLLNPLEEEDLQETIGSSNNVDLVDAAVRSDCLYHVAHLRPDCCLSNDTGVQRRAREGAQRPTRSSDCNALLSGITDRGSGALPRRRGSEKTCGGDHSDDLTGEIDTSSRNYFIFLNTRGIVAASSASMSTSFKDLTILSVVVLYFWKCGVARCDS